MQPNIVTRTPDSKMALKGLFVFRLIRAKRLLYGVALSRDRAQNVLPTMVKPPMVPMKVGTRAATRSPIVAASEPVACR